jgi:chemotaxis protein methyltransferase CheR
VQVRPEEIPMVAQLVYQLCGIVVDASKGYLIESRLSGPATANGCATFSDFCQKLRSSADPVFRNQVIDAITTQETLFFRDSSPFEALQHRVLPNLIDAKAGSLCPKRIRIWSAACSTGQEPYSIAMALCELIPDVLSWDVHILATDISDAAVKHASMGRYAKHEIQRGMKPHLLPKYFHEEPSGWRVSDPLRSLIAFQRRNLLEPFTTLGPFDVIFCRNVAIYFDLQARRSLFLRLADRLTADGTLFVGASESLTDLDAQFQPMHHCRTVYYQRRNKPEERQSVGMANIASLTCQEMTNTLAGKH